MKLKVKGKWFRWLARMIAVPLTHAPSPCLVSCSFYCRFIISCRWSRDCELSLCAHTSCAPSPSFLRSLVFSILLFSSVSLPCVDVLGSAPARRSHARHRADFLEKKTNKSTLLKRKSTSAGSRWMINTIMCSRRYLVPLPCTIVPLYWEHVAWAGWLLSC